MTRRFDGDILNKNTLYGAENVFFNCFLYEREKINIAHEFVLDSLRRCEYLGGRGQYGLVYAADGQAEYRFSTGERCRVSSGDVLLLFPSAAYSIVTDGEFKHYTVNFDIYEDSSDIGFFKKPYYLIHADNSEQYKQSFKHFSSLWGNKKTGYEMLCMSCLYELLSLMCFDIYRENFGDTAHLRLQPAKEFIEKNYRDTIRLDRLAALSDMSVTNFRREWTRIYGETPLQYRDRILIACAREYLLSGYYSVSEVADKCGFDDVSYFARFFKKHTGVSPGAFKRSLAVF